MSNYYKKELKVELKDFVQISPSLIDALGGLYEAALFQRLNFWKDKGEREDGFIYKSAESLQDELRLKRKSFERARLSLVKRGVVEVKYFMVGMSKVAHYRLDISLSQKLIDDSITKYNKEKARRLEEKNKKWKFKE